MTEYRRVVSPGTGVSYARLDGDVWVDITEEDARAAGVWRDPRGDTFGVKDPLATREQLGARDKGAYDPRPASGEFIRNLVVVRCGDCGERIATIEKYEGRILLHNAATGRRYWSDLFRWSLYRCASCEPGLRDIVPRNTSKIESAIERAESDSRTVTVKI
ncbi:hypothetical protein QSU92_01130 [Microbacterium sp. ET2]|uniref:hypothetical protein n=1 Tax=Microbacterium albipurpureum TaxID=3050384 RepID=UPI00259CFAE8|nr:hypothetical protein [Microbacterium sp. ET2 (Ac-2212)]WJL95859.1 hypothetical protein QSU92_01130 [Microbacterium sp. ET2 (Ac-2212)]